MPAKIPAHVREQQINELQNITFVRWDDEYRNSKSKAVCRCTVDGFEWVARVNDLINRGRGCPQCAGNRRWTTGERIDQINALSNITFVRWLDEYRNCYSKAVCRCVVDGHEWSASVNNLLNQGTGCPQCAGKRRWAYGKFHDVTDPVEFDGQLDGPTKWTSELVDWFNTWREMT